MGGLRGGRGRVFFAAGAGSCLVLEEYTDTAAALAHNDRAADLLARVRECADLAHLEFYGPIGPELQQWVAATPVATAYPDLAPAEGPRPA